MKGRKLLALVLCLALSLALAVPALGVETTLQDHTHFDDLKDPRWSWAWPTVDDAIRRGLFIGYNPRTDENGNTVTNFGPGDAVTESVGLTLCARMMLDTKQREAILQDRLEQMRELIPGTEGKPDDPSAPFMWFRREAAACLELGIISEDELQFLKDAGRLGSPMTKSDFAKYLVRAMGLEDFAKGLNANDLPFGDDADIAREYRPFVKLLSTYGVLTGDEKGNFNPNDSMNRAVCATMLSRAIKSIQEDREVSVELAKYTDYKWDAGYIDTVALQEDGSRTMVLKSDLTAPLTVTLPAAVNIYQHNMKVTATELKLGTFAKVCYDGAGKVTAVRLTPAGFLTDLEGECDLVTDSSVTVNGVSYTLDRFTKVSCGGNVGDVSVIDLDAGYTTAKLVANSRKQVLLLELGGGTRLVDGILTSVTTTNLGATTQTTATVNAFNGLPTTYVLTDALSVSVGGREVESLQKSFEGRRVTLRVSDVDRSELVAVDVDVTAQYVQGVLGVVNTKVEPVRVEVTRSGEVKRTPFEVDPECVIVYEGKTTALKDVPLGSFITAKVEGGVLTYLSAWTGLESTTGTLTGLTYDPTVLKVTKADGAVSEFTIPTERLKNVTILVNGQDADITKLATGDTVTVTVHYHDVSQIDVTPRAADVTGTLDAVTSRSGGLTVLTIRFADGSTKDYTASSATSVTRVDKPVDITEVVKALGQTVSLVTDGDKALSIQFNAATVPQDQVEGVILSKDDQDRIATVLVSDPNGGSTRPVNVHIPSGTSITTAQGVPLNNITRLNAGDSVQVFGSYGPDGVFEAKLVIRK